MLEFFTQPTIRLYTVHLRGKKIQIPVAHIRGNTEGKTLLITAGMDGTEYAGIEAAYAVIEKFKSGAFAGRVIIIPIVNIPGFEHESDYNPLDHTYPKRVFPGSQQGSETEQLLYWLSSTFLPGAAAWIDIHGGSLTELLTPFIWSFNTHVAAVDKVVEEFHTHCNAQFVHEKVVRASKAHRLANQGCAYLLFECGERGNRNREDIDTLIAWVESCMSVLGMLPVVFKPMSSLPTLLHKVTEIYATQKGIFRPTIALGDIRKGEKIGIVSNYSNTTHTNILASRSGTLLWRKETMSVVKGDTLYGIGY